VHTIVADVAAPEAERMAAGLVPGRAAAIAANPPFYPPYKVTMSPSAGKAAAHAQDVGIEDWCRFAAWALRPGGILVMVAHAESLAELVDHLPGRFGSIAVVPVHPRPDLPAARILIRAVKGSRGPLALLPGLVLHGTAGGAFAPPISAMLKGRRTSPPLIRSAGASLFMDGSKMT
jgi:tRNA1(Val) A37 N6-methylase TrmN6